MRRNGTKIPRTTDKDIFLIFGLGATGITGTGLFQMLRANYSSVPWWAWPIVGLLPLAFFCMFLVGLIFLAYCAQHVELDRHELRLCLGPVVLRRIPAVSVRTIGYGEIDTSETDSRFGGLLMVSTRTPEELTEEGKRLLDKRKSLRRNFSNRGMNADRWDTRLQACFEHRMLWALAGFGKDIALGYTLERAMILKKNLPTAVFCVKRQS